MAGFDKLVGSYEEALAGLTDGMTVVAGGFGLCGISGSLIAQVQKMGVEVAHASYPTTAAWTTSASDCC